MLSRFCRSFFRFSVSSNALRVHPVAGYKSQCNIDKLYSNISQESINDVQIKPKETVANEAGKYLFSGYIPIDKLQIKSMKGSGPGGQHVNKVNTKVEVRFHIQSCDWIPDWVKLKLTEQQSNRINKEGYLIITSDKTRKQILNQADCMDKIRTMVRQAAYEPEPPSAEDIKLREKRMAIAKQKIIKEKKINSLKKQSRQAPLFS